MTPNRPRPTRRIARPGEKDTSAMGLLRAKTQKRLALPGRMGLLSRKSLQAPLDDVEKKMLEHELAIAEELQANLLPHRIPQIPGYELSAYYRPSHDVGGDYYDFIEIDSEHLGIVVADVSGKGIPGSIVMTETRALLKSEGVRTRSPAEAVIRVNRFLYPDIKRGMFVTMFYMVLSIPKRTLTVTSAGHTPMVLFRKQAGTCHLVNPNGLALGIDKGPLFEKTVKEQRIQLNEGDRFIVYTDGIIESMNADSEILGTTRFYINVKEWADGGSSEFVTKIIQSVEAHQGDAPQHDDITLVTGRIVPVPAPKP